MAALLVSLVVAIGVATGGVALLRPPRATAVLGMPTSTAAPTPARVARPPAVSAAGSIEDAMTATPMSSNSAAPAQPRVGLGSPTAPAAKPPPSPVATSLPAGSVRVPVLLYHYIRDNPSASDRTGFNLSVTPGEFKAQLRWLQAHGYHSVTMDQAMNAISDGAPLPANPVVLTFDDGYADFATTAVPTLVEFGFTGEAYVAPGLLDHPGYMSTAQLLQVVDQGITIGAHTVHHVDLARVPVPIAMEEIASSRSQLQRITGEAITDFAYPYGAVNGTVERLVAQAGFRDATTTRSGADHRLRSDPFMVSRVRVRGGESLATFAASLGR